MVHGSRVPMNAIPSLAHRFWSKVEIRGPEDCWLWQASFTKQGYGQIMMKDRPVHAHRVALMRSGVEVIPRMHVHHHCQVRACVNPGHLELLSSKDHYQHHLTGCAKHGESEQVVQAGGKHAGRRYCKACLRESARRRRATGRR